MGLGSLFTRNLTYNVTDSLNGDSQSFTVITDMGLIPEWDYGHYQGGMSIPGAWRASVLLSDLIGSVPWDAYRERAGNPIEKISPTPLILEQPNPPDTRMTTFSSWALDLIWHGNAIGLIAARNPAGWPTAIIGVPADWVQVKRIGFADQEIGLPAGAIVYLIGGTWYSSDDVVHIKGPCRPGFIRGMGVLENHLRGGLGLAHELSRQAGQLSKSGVPTGLLKSTDPDLDQTDADDLKAKWLQAQRDRTVAVLNETTDFEPLSWNPTDMQLLEARKFSLSELALIFGLPLSFLGAEMASKTYSNAENESLDLIKFSMGGHLARFEQTLSLHLPRGTVAKANLDALLRSDTLTRYQAHQIGLAAGFLTDDEVRSLEDLPPLTSEQRAAAAPAGGAASTGQTPTEVARNLVEMVQKVYLGVGVLMTADEARAVLNKAGAGLSPHFAHTDPAPTPAAPGGSTP